METKDFFIHVTCSRLKVDLLYQIELTEEEQSRSPTEIDRLVLESLGDIAANEFDEKPETTSTEEK